jgi:acylglycerol lipase
VSSYDEFCESLADDSGIATYGFDQRGWGRSVKSVSDRGRTGPTATVLADMAAFIEARLSSSSSPSLSPPPPPPTFLLGYSMGGGQVLALASTPAYGPLVSRLRGLVLGAPFVGFAPEFQPPALVVYAGRLASLVLPNWPVPRPTNCAHLSRRPEAQARHRDDPLRHRTGTLQGLAGLLERTAALADGQLALPVGDTPHGGATRLPPLLLAHGTADKLCSFDVSRKWYDAQKHLPPGSEFRAYEGMYHVLHEDIGGEVFVRDVAEWILARTRSGLT